MQSVKVYVRQVGLQNKELDIVSAEDLSLEIEYKYTSVGYVLQSSSWLGEVKNGNGDTLGYKVGFVFVKEVDNPAEAKKK